MCGAQVENRIVNDPYERIGVRLMGWRDFGL
jgi:hypothetical protein